MTYADSEGLGFQPIDYVIRVYRTRELAEVGKVEDALSIMHSYANPLVSHAAQVITGQPTDVSGTSQLIDAGLEQITTMTIPADSSNSLDGKYFKIFVPSASVSGLGTGRADRLVAVWINTSGGSATRPGVDGVNSYVEVAVTTNSNATVVAAAIASALDSSSNFDATGTGSSTSTLTIKNAFKGACTTAVDGDMGVTSIAVTQIGRLAAKFGTDLVGAEVENTSTGLRATVSAATSTTLTLSADIFHSTSHDYRINDKPSHYFTYQRYYYRIESTDPVKGFIIDWDDGEDNSPEKANRQEIILDTPRYYTVVEHVYTKHTKFYPMIRTISPEGFYSKYYVSSGAVTDSGGNTLKALEEDTLTPGQNNFSIVSVDAHHDYDNNPRIPEFYPANTPPVAVLKLDRNEIFAGIDNTRIRDYSASGTIIKPRAIALIDGHSSATTIVSALEVVYRNHEDKVFKETIAITNQETGSNSLKARFPNSGGTEASTGTPTANGADPTNGYLKELLSVKLIKLLENTTSAESATQLELDEKVQIYWYNSYGSGTNDTDPQAIGGTPVHALICQVSNGDPIVTVDRPGYSVIADGGQSLVKNSNRSISAYRFEEGKTANYRDQIGTSQTTVLTTQVSDVFELNNGGTAAPNSTNFGSAEPQRRIAYTLDPALGIAKDSVDKRYYAQEKLIRLQVKDDWTGDNGGDDMTYSFIEHDAIESYADASTSALRPDELRSRGLLWYANHTASLQQWTNRQQHNANITGGEGDKWIVFGDAFEAGSAGLFSQTNKDTALTSFANGLSKNPANWVLVGKDTKFDRLHFNMGNEHRSYSADNTFIVAYYATKESPTSTNYIWKPLQITDNTSHNTPNTSFRNSGSVIFSTPSDWAKVKASDLESSVDVGWAGPISNISASINISSNDRDINSIGLAEITTATDHGLSTGDFVHIADTGGSDADYDITTKITKVDANELTYYTTHTSVSNLEGSITPKIYWDENMYCILIGIGCSNDAGDLASYKCYNVRTYNNEHSSVVKIIDGHHKSLNDIAIAQSVSWTKSGKYYTVEDRLGRAEIRKLGAAGGKVSFGGVDLGNFNSSGTGTDSREKLANYQRRGTPVFLDVKRANGERIRFFGKIESMSEDVPTALQKPKFGISMIVSHILELDVNGAWITNGLIALGGDVIDEPNYLL